MKKNRYIALILGTLVLTSCGETSFNELGEITLSTDKIVQDQTFKALVDAPQDIDINWSVSNDLATVTQEGEVTTKSKDGTFILTASYGENNEFSSSKLIKIHTPTVKELTKILYEAGKNYNYTVSLRGKLFDNEGNEVTREDIIQYEDPYSDAIYLYEDLVEKGNLYKSHNDGYYWQYGIDGLGNLYEGGSYNSPDGFVYDYSMVNGVFTKGNVDYFSGMTGISDYKELYTNDLSKFVDDEFKVEDSNLVLSEDKTKLLYDSLKDGNDFKNELAYSRDYSIPQAIYNTVDSSYAASFQDIKAFDDLKGDISYDDEAILMNFRFKNLSLSGSGIIYDYLVTFKIYDIGSTIIPGLEEQIETDKELLK